VWIMKPVGRAQGKGIFLVNKLSQIEGWLKVLPTPAMRRTQRSRCTQYQSGGEAMRAGARQGQGRQPVL
jgi:hypothetical protein